MLNEKPYILRVYHQIAHRVQMRHPRRDNLRNYQAVGPVISKPVFALLKRALCFASIAAISSGVFLTDVICSGIPSLLFCS